MKRKLAKQIFRERNSNLWLVVELLLVGSIIWWIADYSYSILATKSQPLGLEIDHTYQIEIEEKPQAEEVGGTENADNDTEQKEPPLLPDKKRLRAILWQDSAVEAVTSSYFGSPINRSYMGRSYRNADSTANLKISHSTNSFTVQPDFFRVFRTRGIKGETPEQLEEILKSGKLVVTENLIDRDSCNSKIEELYGTTIKSNEGEFMIGAVIPGIRRYDYEPLNGATIIKGIPYDNVEAFYVRLKPEADESSFFERMEQLSKRLSNSGNIYISSCKSYEDIRRATNKSDDAAARNIIASMIFLLVVVFLGILGTFWFRTQERVHEIAIRKVAGATNRQIFMRLIGEGIFLVAIATPFSMAIDVLVAKAGHSTYFETFGVSWGVLFAVAGVVAGILCVMTSLGIFFPAWKASKIDPAVTLRNE